MVVSAAEVCCVAYLLGLLVTGITGFSLPFTIPLLPPVSLLSALAVGAFAVAAPRPWKLGLSSRQWGVAAIAVLLAGTHLSLRTPAPSANDISHYVERAQSIAPTHLVSGIVIDEPQLNRGLKGKFRLRAAQLQIQDDAGDVTFQVQAHGILYVTAPLPQVTGLHAGQRIRAKGRLYRPQPALNPGGFDFQAYLESQGIFAGLAADELQFSSTPAWGLWQLRQRVTQTQVKALGSPLGQLVSAMALGRKAVDLPFDLQDLFSQVGLAHTVAASGFHVSLLLGSVLVLVRSRTGTVQLGVGLTVLGSYVALTGLQASVVRAALMGVAALVGLALERQVKPLGALLLAITVMLLFNPNWIWDVGFQLSVAATFGLLVMVPTLSKGLDWLPVTLVPLLAVPVAATLWTLPLMLYHFNVMSGVSIVLNAIATPLITLISLGGIGTSAIALVSTSVGQVAASFLYYPLQLLLWLANTSHQLPGSAISVGQISIWQLLGLYGVLALTLVGDRRSFLRWVLPVSFLGLLLLPIGWRLFTQQRITLLATGDELVWVMQDHGRTTLLNSGGGNTAFYTVQPFLRQAGVNHLAAAIAPALTPEAAAVWQSLLQQVPSAALYGGGDVPPDAELSAIYQPLTVGQSSRVGRLTVQPLGTENPILRLTTHQSWLLLPSLSLELQTHLAGAGSVLRSQVLVWPGEALSEPLLAAVQPEVIICYGRSLPTSMERHLQQAGKAVYWTARDGAISWTPTHGFRSHHETIHRSLFPLG